MFYFRLRGVYVDFIFVIVKKIKTVFVGKGVKGRVDFQRAVFRAAFVVEEQLVALKYGYFIANEYPAVCANFKKRLAGKVGNIRFINVKF